ncbi:MAG: hypothetical protein II375_07285 [Bacteroidales bacterium]|nr:hypothetical protein [Bacteroidales bacterium]
MPAPIVLFAYNRPEHTARALRSLAAADMAESTDLIIFCDGPKETPDDAERVAKVRAACRAATGFRSVRIQNDAPERVEAASHDASSPLD